MNISHITFRDCRVHIFPTTFLEIAVYLVKRWQAFYSKRARIPNRLRTSINPGSNDEGDGDGDGNEPNKQVKNNKFCRSSALFFTTCTYTIVNFLLRRCLEDINTRANWEMLVNNVASVCTQPEAELYS